jgi:hypothetical protein
MQGMIAGFGTHTVEGDTVTIKWIASSYGTTEKRTGGTSNSKLARVK